MNSVFQTRDALTGHRRFVIAISVTFASMIVNNRANRTNPTNQIKFNADGEVYDTALVIQLARQNPNANRCFVIGLGSRADAGRVQ
jgi:hypothetical protein